MRMKRYTLARRKKPYTFFELDVVSFTEKVNSEATPKVTLKVSSWVMEDDFTARMLTMLCQKVSSEIKPRYEQELLFLEEIQRHDDDSPEFKSWWQKNGFEDRMRVLQDTLIVGFYQLRFTSHPASVQFQLAGASPTVHARHKFPNGFEIYVLSGDAFGSNGRSIEDDEATFEVSILFNGKRYHDDTVIVAHGETLRLNDVMKNLYRGQITQVMRNIALRPEQP